MTTPVAHAGIALRHLDWLLGRFVVRTSGVRDAIAVSSEGRVIASSRTLDRTRTDQWAVHSCALLTLVRGAGLVGGLGAVRKVLVDLDDGYLLVSPISVRWALVVSAAATADLGSLAYDVSCFTDELGRQLRRRLGDDVQIWADA